MQKLSALEGAQTREHESVVIHYPLCYVHRALVHPWSSLGTKDVKGRGRESQVNM